MLLADQPEPTASGAVTRGPVTSGGHLQPPVRGSASWPVLTSWPTVGQQQRHSL
jgi:hypothetical protein